MLRYKTKLTVVSAAAILLGAFLSTAAETWRLEKDKDQWKQLSVSTDRNDNYLLAVAKVKQMVYTGKADAAAKAMEQLKKDFPEITGADLDAFIKAESYYSQCKYKKAVTEYDRFLETYPDSELYEAALDREFAIATAFLNGEKIPVLGVFRIKGYEEGGKIMERINDRAGDRPVGEKAMLAIAESYEKRGKFNEAYLQWSQISSQWPTGRLGKQSLLSMARCKHAAYRGPAYDSSSLISAKSYYEDFMLRYPQEASQYQIDNKIDQITEQMAYKNFKIGKYYQQTGSKNAADFYYRLVVDKWPDSTAAKMAAKQISGEEKT